MAKKDIHINKDHIGTLHAHAYRSLGQPELADTPKGLKLWNAYIKSEGIASWTLEGGGVDVDEAPQEAVYGQKSKGDLLHEEISLCRARMVDERLWRDETRGYYEKWCRFKAENCLLDFADLIETAYHDVDRAPGDPGAIFADEAQDIDKIEMLLIRKWGAHARTFIIVGDPDQNLYLWRGTDPHVMQTPPVAEDHRRILSQSYRVPRAVHDAAVKWIETIPGRERIEYTPRREGPHDKTSPIVEGELLRNAGTYKYLDPVIRQAETYMAAGKSVMFLTACGYMLEPLKARLKDMGIAFHNPFRRKRGDWNPLAARRGTSSSDRINAFMRLSRGEMWTGNDVVAWGSVLNAEGIFNRGKKSKLIELKSDDEVEIGKMLTYFTEEAVSHAMDANSDWWFDNLIAMKQKSMRYHRKILKREGRVDKDIQVILGTVHSVKGGEADVVFLMPDISTAAAVQWSRGPGELRNGIIRQFYVGMTRARESLVLCSGATRWSVRL